MAELRPYPFGALATHMFRELDERGSIFELPAAKFYAGEADLDLSVSLHGHRASTPLGPAAGPHTQMAQNIVLAWLAGCRIIELKTVQVLDELTIPRPCIDMQTIGYNVEWSQELKLEQSLREYVAASMLIQMLEHRGVVPLQPGYDDLRMDMSVGYDLAGIRTPAVTGFLEGIRDCSAIVDQLRGELVGACADLRDLDFRTDLSDTLTLSTFHGCPPDEIERIVDHLLREHRLSCTIKLNPTLLGPTECRGLLNDQLGYADHVPDSAFANDATWEQVVDFAGRLGDTADELGLGFGVKFTNTLIVDNHRDFFPKDEKVMYLSGQPLHVLAMHLVRRFRRTFGDRWPISFSAGIDQHNFADAVALGLVPITVCSDLLRPGGYGRASSYFHRLTARMREAGARDVDHWVLAYGNAEAALDTLELDPETHTRALETLNEGRPRESGVFDRWVSAARLANTETYVGGLATDARYSREGTAKIPRKVDSHLQLFDCLSCHKCVPVCPNAANFEMDLPPRTLVPVRLRWTGAAFESSPGEALTLDKPHQYGTFADFCNECGNCDVFCPEHGGPYAIKPLFFGTEGAFDQFADHDGIHLGDDRVLGRFGGERYAIELGSEVRFSGPSFTVRIAPDGDPASVEPVEVAEGAVVDLGWFHVLDWLREGVGRSVNLVHTRSEAP